MMKFGVLALLVFGFISTVTACSSEKSEARVEADEFTRSAEETAFATKVFDAVRKSGNFDDLIPNLRPERGFAERYAKTFEHDKRRYLQADETMRGVFAADAAKFGVTDVENSTLAEWCAKLEFSRRTKRDESFPQGLKDLGEPIFEDDESEGAWWIARMGKEGKQALALAIKKDPEGGEYYVSYIDYAPWAERANKSK